MQTLRVMTRVALNGMKYRPPIHAAAAVAKPQQQSNRGRPKRQKKAVAEAVLQASEQPAAETSDQVQAPDSDAAMSDDQ